MGDSVRWPFHIQSRHSSVSAARVQNRAGGTEESCIWGGRRQRSDPPRWRGVPGPREISARLQEIKSWETQLLPCRRCWGDLRLASGARELKEDTVEILEKFNPVSSQLFSFFLIPVWLNILESSIRAELEYLHETNWCTRWWSKSIVATQLLSHTLSTICSYVADQNSSQVDAPMKTLGFFYWNNCISVCAAWLFNDFCFLQCRQKSNQLCHLGKAISHLFILESLKISIHMGKAIKLLMTKSISSILLFCLLFLTCLPFISEGMTFWGPVFLILW